MKSRSACSTWLANLAVWDDDRVAAFLDERGLDARRDPALIDRARSLFEQVATARPGLTVNTFHGWFSALLAAAPLSSGLAGQQLAERTAPLRDQAWAVLMRRAGGAPEGELAQSVRWLLAQCGIAGTQKLAAVLIDRRAEWQAWLDSHGNLEGVLAHLRGFFGADAEDPVETLLMNQSFRAAARELAALSGKGGARLQQTAAALSAAGDSADAQRYFKAMRSALCTDKGEPRAYKVDKPLLATGTGDRALLLFEYCVGCVRKCDRALSDLAAWTLNDHGLRVASALLDAYDRIQSATPACSISATWNGTPRACCPTRRPGRSFRPVSTRVTVICCSTSSRTHQSAAVAGADALARRLCTGSGAADGVRRG